MSDAEKIDDKTIALAAKAAYERFVKEAGFEHDARIRDWGKLAYPHQRRWAAIARAVIESFRSVDRQRSAVGVHGSDGRPVKLRQRKRGPTPQKSSTRNRGARRKDKV